MDEVTNEMIKYGSEKLYAEVVKFTKIMFIQIHVDWKSYFSIDFLKW